MSDEQPKLEVESVRGQIAELPFLLDNNGDISIDSRNMPEGAYNMRIECMLGDVLWISYDTTDDPHTPRSTSPGTTDHPAP